MILGDAPSCQCRLIQVPNLQGNIEIAPTNQNIHQCRYAVAWEGCERLIRIGRSFGLSGVLSVLDFGPLTMLVGALDSSQVRAYVDESIGEITRHDQEKETAYLDTLTAYLRERCRAQACANAMALHVSTLRYRLERIRDLFDVDVDVDTPEKRFAAELAIQLHRLAKTV
jgi:DNA-binding PucR family transcriptional regulator